MPSQSGKLSCKRTALNNALRRMSISETGNWFCGFLPKGRSIFGQGMKGAGELKRLVLPSSRRQWKQTYNYINHLNLRISLLCSEFGCRPDITSSSWNMYESANGQMTVTSQQSALPFCQGTRESPSGRFPSKRDKPVGSLTTGTPAAEKLWAINSVSVLLSLSILVAMLGV